MGRHSEWMQKLLRLVINMSRKKKNKQVAEEAELYQVPPEIEKLDDSLVLSKSLVVKIIKDMIRGERERYKKYVLNVSVLFAKVELLETRLKLFEHKGTKNAPKLVTEETRIDRMDDELTGLNERINELDDAVDTLYAAYNCMQDYPKHSAYKTINRDAFDEDDSSKDTPPDSLVDCGACAYRVDEYSSRGYKYDSLYGKCCCKDSTWFRQIVHGSRICPYFYAAVKGQITSGNISTTSRIQSYYSSPPLRTTNKPVFFGYDLTTLEKEEFQCLKD